MTIPAALRNCPTEIIADDGDGNRKPSVTLYVTSRHVGDFAGWHFATGTYFQTFYLDSQQ
jgi:hypothetical protein